MAMAPVRTSAYGAEEEHGESAQMTAFIGATVVSDLVAVRGPRAPPRANGRDGAAFGAPARARRIGG